MWWLITLVGRFGGSLVISREIRWLRSQKSLAGRFGGSIEGRFGGSIAERCGGSLDERLGGLLANIWWLIRREIL